MLTPKDWIEVPGSDSMELAAARLGGAYNKVWKDRTPKSEKILTKQWGENHIVGARGHWAVGRLLDEWGVKYSESPVFWDHGDKCDYDISDFGIIDVKTRQLHSTNIPYPDRVGVNKEQANKMVDLYVHCCWHSVRNILWIIGWLWREEYIAKSTLYKTGQFLCGEKVKDDYFVASTADLKPMSCLKAIMAPDLAARQLSLF